MFSLSGEITLPTPETNDELKEVLKLKIQSGEYTVGELIVPKKYKKFVLDSKGSVITKEFTIEGRKMPLNEIRKKTLKKQYKYIRHHNNSYYEEMSRLDVANRLRQLNEFDDSEGLEAMRRKLKAFERQRHLLIWHDHSTVANHGHLVFMVSCAYDPAIFYTPEEYYEIHGCKVDIQAEVEMPEIYIVGRCSSSDVEQLAYTETRCECLQGLSTPIEAVPGVPINDIMRFFKGDGPAVAFETGQQKGGHYFCSVCGMHSVMSDDLENVFRCKHVSLQDKQKKILKGQIGKINSKSKKPKPLQDLKKKDLIQELKDRRLLPANCNDNNLPQPTKKDLQNILTAELQGVQRVPALLYCTPTSPLSFNNLDSYEALQCEPMHDISNHISNVLEELPTHLTAEQRSVFDETMKLTLGCKETKRATDYRYAIILFAKRLKNILPETLNTLLTTLVEMQEILYTKDYSRCPRLILRYHNVSFLHFLMCKIEFGSTPNALTSRKLYGKYLHDLTSHAPIQLRIISGPSSNAENEERTFNAIKSITSSTSNYRPSHVISNILLRLQAEQKIGTAGSVVQKQQNLISKAAATISEVPNTRIPSFILEENIYSRLWQAHLERISDFLLPGEGIWWKYLDDTNEIELFDSTSEPDSRPDGPLLHHFRSSSFKQEEDYLAQCWHQCINNNIKLPTHYLYQENASGKVVKVQTNYLSSDTCPDENESFPKEDYINEYTHIYADPEIPEQEEERVIAICLDDDEPDVGDENVVYNCELNTQICEDPKIPEQEEEIVTDFCLEKDESDVDNNSDSKTLHTETHPRITKTIEENSHFNESSYLIHHDNLDTTNISNNPSNSEKNTKRNTCKDNASRAIETKLGKAVENVLGSTAQVRKFDAARRLLKNNPNINTVKENYKNTLAPLQTKILSERTVLKRKLNDWEKQFVLDNECVAPSSQEMKQDQFASQCMKKLKYCDALIKEWNIKL